MVRDFHIGKPEMHSNNSRRSGDSDGGGVEFPDGGDLGGAAIVIKVLECHAENLNGQGLRDFAAVLGIETEIMLG